MNKIKEMEARKKDARLKALAILEKAQAEGRFLTEEEEKQVRQIEEEMKRWDDTIARTRALMEEEEQPEERDMEPAKPNPRKTPEEGEQRFATFGEQMLAVYRAAAPDGRVDPRPIKRFQEKGCMNCREIQASQDRYTSCPAWRKIMPSARLLPSRSGFAFRTIQDLWEA